MSLDVIVSMNITVGGAATTRPGFGTPLFAVYHTNYVDLVRSYSSPEALLDDGFTVDDPAFKMATVCFSQSPHPPTFKVGRRDNAFSQVMNLAPINLTEGFEYDFSVVDLKSATVPIKYVVGSSETVATVTTALHALLDPAAATVSAGAGPYVLTDGMTLNFLVDGVLFTTLFETADFAAIGAATAAELVTVISVDMTAQGYTGTIVVSDSPSGTLLFTSPTLGGPRSTIRILSGTSIAALSLSTTEVVGVGVEGLTPTDVSTHISCSTLAAGTLFDFVLNQMHPTNDLDVENVTADPGLTADLAAIIGVDPDGWYALALDSNGAAEILAAEAFLQTKEKIGAFYSSDSEIVDIATVDDVFSNSQAASYTHSHLQFYQRSTLSHIGAGILGVMLPTDPGTSTWAHKTIVGVLADTISDSHKTIVLNKGGNYYRELGGLNLTWQGLSPGNEYLDTVRFLHFLKINLQLDLLSALAANPKISYTNIGISIVKGVIEARLISQVETPSTARGLSADPAPVVTVPRAEAVLKSLKQARRLQDVTFGATLAGAIHEIAVVGKLAA